MNIRFKYNFLSNFLVSNANLTTALFFNLLRVSKVLLFYSTHFFNRKFQGSAKASGEGNNF